jgi:hypothetical protein
MLEKHGFKTAGFCGLKNYKGKRVYPKAPEATKPPDADAPKPVPDR